MARIIDPSDVCLVTVTYGDRADMCLSVVEEALSQGVGHAIIIANGTAGSSLDKLAGYAQEQVSRVQLIQLPHNLGSAGGFAIGLQHAAEHTSTSHIWILDDDNVPQNGVLRELLHWKTFLKQDRATQDVVVFAARPNAAYIGALLRGVPATRAYPSRGGFAGFNLIEIPRKLHIKIAGKFGPGSVITRPVEIPFGPYGGMLLSRSFVDIAGYPDKRLVLYEDDTDYSRRLHEAGAKLFLVPSAIIEDIDTSWYTKSRGRTQFGRVLEATSDSRVYFATRNKVYFENQRWSGPRWLYLLNKYTYIATLWLLAWTSGRQERFRLIIEAAQRGEKQDFGRIGVTSDGDKLIGIAEDFK